MKGFKVNLLEKIRSNKKIQAVIICFFAVILLIVFVSTYVNNDKTVNTTSTMDNYVNQLENKLSNTLSKVEGAGKVSAVITVESGMETVIAMKTVSTQTENGTIIEETPILVNGKTVVLKEKYPKIIGVLLVVEGADSISVVYKIQQATISLLDIKLNQIEILTMK